MHTGVSDTHFVIVTLALCSYIMAVVGQGLVVPSTWVDTTSNLSRGSREALASGAAMALHAHVDPSVQTTPDLGGSPDPPQQRYYSSTFAVLALQDYYSGNTTWNDTVTNGLLAYNSAYGFYGNRTLPNNVNSDSAYWGLTFFYAYRTYRQQVLLERAKAAYNTTYMNGFITLSAAETGTGAGRNITFLPRPANCTGHPSTYAGGVFWSKDRQNVTVINAYTVAPFMTLSAYLFEETGDPIYQQAAQLSVNFALNHLWNGTLFPDTDSSLSCTNIVYPVNSLDQWFVEGLSVWANVTKNDTLTSFLEQVIPSVVTSGPWTLDNGIIKEGSEPQDQASIYKGIFIRALAEARMRNPGTALATYIEAYITVQFNAVLTHARASNTDFYTTAWSSGIAPPTTFVASGNIAALDVLNAAFSFATATTSSSPPSNTSSSPGHDNPTKPTSKPRAGVIAGGAIGGVVASAATFMAFLWWYRRRNQAKNDQTFQRGSSGAVQGNVAVDTQPFVQQAPSVALSGKWQRFYATRNEETPTSMATPSETVPIAEGGDRGASSELTDQIELPTLVHRLYELVQRRHESPPQYEG